MITKDTSPVKKTDSKHWKPVLCLDSQRKVTSGSFEKLRKSIGAAADLRIHTDFYFHEHLELNSPNQEMVNEVSEFATTYLVEGRWAAGVMTRRMPINSLPGFGPRPSMSLFLYNENGEQAIARTYFDGIPKCGEIGLSTDQHHVGMRKYHQIDAWDTSTCSPSTNFIYDFECFRYFVSDTWEEIYGNDEKGSSTFGRLDDLIEAFMAGAEIKVGIADLCLDLAQAKTHSEIFVQVGPGYYHRDLRLFYAGTHPTVRIAPAMPMRYFSRGWDFGSFIPRTDGTVYRWICDPYTMQFKKSTAHHAIRWFVRG